MGPNDKKFENVTSPAFSKEQAESFFQMKGADIYACLADAQMCGAAYLAAVQYSPDDKTALRRMHALWNNMPARFRMTCFSSVYAQKKGDSVEISNALLMAIKRKNKRAIEWLCEKGADVNVRDEMGNTAFMRLLQTFRVPDQVLSSSKTDVLSDELFSLFVRSKPDVKAVNNNGETTLMAAALNPRVMMFLMRRGVSGTAVSKTGQTVIDFWDRYAREVPDESIVKAAWTFIQKHIEGQLTPCRLKKHPLYGCRVNFYQEGKERID